MTTIPTETQVISEDGADDVANVLTLRLDESTPDCPVLLIIDGKPVFSLGNAEIADFVTALQQFSLQ